MTNESVRVITKEEFLKLDISKVDQVYYGTDNACRCGCKGDYFSTSHNKDIRSEVDDARVQFLLEMAQKRAIRSKSVQYDDEYVNVPFGRKAITVYFNQI